MSTKSDNSETLLFSATTCAEAERLIKLMEECAEVIQICSKILRHGWDSRDPTVDPLVSVHNRRLLCDEVADVLAALEAIYRQGDIARELVNDLVPSRYRHALKYMHHQGDAW